MPKEADKDVQLQYALKLLRGEMAEPAVGTIVKADGTTEMRTPEPAIAEKTDTPKADAQKGDEPKKDAPKQ